MKDPFPIIIFARFLAPCVAHKLGKNLITSEQATHVLAIAGCHMHDNLEEDVNILRTCFPEPLEDFERIFGKNRKRAVIDPWQAPEHVLAFWDAHRGATPVIKGKVMGFHNGDTRAVIVRLGGIDRHGQFTTECEDQYDVELSEIIRGGATVTVLNAFKLGLGHGDIVSVHNGYIAYTWT
jgi:hypothetical protein